MRDGEEPRESVSKATKALRQKAKVLGRFKGLGKVSSEQASEVGSEESGKKDSLRLRCYAASVNKYHEKGYFEKIP